MSIYLENAASTPLLDETLNFYSEQIKKLYANPHADNDFSRSCRKAISTAEKQLKESVNADGNVRIIWTSGGTECINSIIFGLDWQAGDEVIVSGLEHPATLNPLEQLSSQGVVIKKLAIDKNGRYSLEDFQSLLNASTKLVSTMSIQNEIGVINDLAGIRQVLDDNNNKALFHTDNVQGFGKLQLDWKKCRFDFMSTAGHKFHAPNSCGALLINSKIHLKPLLFGGGQQNGQRPGTQDAAVISAYGYAAEFNHKHKADKLKEISALNEACREGLSQLKNKQSKNVELIFHSDTECTPYILTFSIKGFQGAVIMRFLSSMGIYIGVGSACSAETKAPNKTLTAMGINKEIAFGAIRVSFGWQNSLDDVKIFLEKIQEVIKSY